MIVNQGRHFSAKMAFEEMAMETKRLHIKNLRSAGVNVISIAASGDVYPCNFFQDTPFRLGNLREKSLEGIWKESETVRGFRDLVVPDLPMYRQFEWRYMCSGGS